ncbi:MAG TPA: hypothetical protein DDW54_01055 [Clostridiales bacterium]|nr:hypothetical protein [Clostridiales bacterium]
MSDAFFKTAVKKDITVKSIYTIHYQALGKNYVSKEETHDFWEINYTDKEDMTVVLSGKPIEVKRGEILFIRPNEPHYVKAGEKEPNVFIITFECRSKAMDFFIGRKSAVGSNDRALLQEIMSEAEKTFNIPEFDPDLKELEFKTDCPLGGLQSISNLLELFLIRSIRRDTEKHNSYRFMLSVGENTDLKERIILFLSEKIYSTFSLEELCDHLHYKKAWLCSYFYKRTGSHIYGTYIKMKMDEAKKLIRQKYTFTEISDKLCFDNAAYFSAAFKKHVGMTPKEYKASIR